jgi:guanylate kinase
MGNQLTQHSDYDVFLSHSSSDKDYVRPLVQELRSRGFRVFFDEEVLHVGDSLFKALSSALEACEYLVFCVSRASTTSGWVEREVGGSLAEQAKRQRKRILPVLLDDTSVPALLADLVWLDMGRSTPSDVAKQIAAAIEADRASRLKMGGYPRDVTDLVAAALEQLGGGRVATGFCWFIISGASSTGKDVLSYVALQRLQQSHGLTFLNKMTTRARRPSEPNYVSQIEDAEFEHRVKSGDVMFPFRKRASKYGFDGIQFKAALRDGAPLLSVFTEFRLVPAVVKAMNARGVRTTAFLVTADKADLLRRILFRNLPPEEVASRIVSIEQDYEEMDRRPSLKNEYTIIENGDMVAFRDAATKLVDAIQKTIESQRAP